MAQVIEVPGLGQVEFPDGMSDAAISAAIKHNLARSDVDMSGSVMSPQSRAAEIAAKQTGPGEAFLVSAGRTVDKIGSGLRALAFGDSPDMRAEQTAKDAAYAPLTRERPFAAAFGEAAPGIVAAAPARSLAAIAGISGGMGAAEYGTPQERATRGALGAAGGAVGGLAGRAVGAALNPTTEAVRSPSKQAALEAMDRLGMQPRLSEVTGAPFLARAEDFAARFPGGAGHMREFANRNQQAVNRAAARAIGQNADELTPEVFAAARQQIGQAFDAVRNLPGRPITVTRDVADAADEILRQQARMLPNQVDPALANIAQQARLWGTRNGRIDGETYQFLRSGLSEASYDAAGTTRTQYGRLLEALDDAAERSLRAGGHGDVAAGLRAARPQYQALTQLEKGMVAEGGNVSPARLASVMRQQSPSAFREGRHPGPMLDIARVGEAFKPLQAGSPTAERSLWNIAAGAVPSFVASRVTTSPAAQWYPRNVGGTQGAEIAAMLANPATRAAALALLQRTTAPQVAE